MFLFSFLKRNRLLYSHARLLLLSDSIMAGTSCCSFYVIELSDRSRRIFFKKLSAVHWQKCIVGEIAVI